MNDDHVLPFGNTTLLTNMFNNKNEVIDYYKQFCIETEENQIKLKTKKPKQIRKTKTKQSNFEDTQKEKLSKCIKLMTKNSKNASFFGLFCFKHPFVSCTFL